MSAGEFLKLVSVTRPGSGIQNPLLMSPDTTRVSGSGAKSPLLLQPIFLKKPKAVKAPVIEEIPEPVDIRARTCSFGPPREGSRHMTTQDVDELKAKCPSLVLAANPKNPQAARPRILKKSFKKEKKPLESHRKVDKTPEQYTNLECEQK